MISTTGDRTEFQSDYKRTVGTCNAFHRFLREININEQEENCDHSRIDIAERLHRKNYKSHRNSCKIFRIYYNYNIFLLCLRSLSHGYMTERKFASSSVHDVISIYNKISQQSMLEAILVTRHIFIESQTFI